jgi:hypothetical protein
MFFCETCSRWQQQRARNLNFQMKRSLTSKKIWLNETAIESELVRLEKRLRDLQEQTLKAVDAVKDLHKVWERRQTGSGE